MSTTQHVAIAIPMAKMSMSASYATHVMLHIQKKKKMRILASTIICGILIQKSQILNSVHCIMQSTNVNCEGLLRNDKNKVQFFITKFSLSTWSYTNRTHAPIHFIVYVYIFFGQFVYVYIFELKICNMILGK